MKKSGVLKFMNLLFFEKVETFEKNTNFYFCYFSLTTRTVVETKLFLKIKEKNSKKSNLEKKYDNLLIYYYYRKVTLRLFNIKVKVCLEVSVMLLRKTTKTKNQEMQINTYLEKIFFQQLETNKKIFILKRIK